MTSIEPDAIIDCDTCYGLLSVGGVQLLNEHGAWCLPDLSPLWGSPDEVGDDLYLPGTTGLRAYPRRSVGVVHSLRFLCSGQIDGVTGDTPTEAGISPEAMLQQNMSYLRATVFAPVGSGTGTRPAVWTLPNGDTVEANVRARIPAGGVQLLPKAFLRATVELSDPGGVLHLPATLGS